MIGLPLTIHFPGKLVFGNGVLAQLENEVIALQPKRVFIATIEPMRSIVNGIVKRLAQMQIETLVDITIVAEPSIDDFELLMPTVAHF